MSVKFDFYSFLRKSRSDFKKEKFTTIIDHRFLEVKQNMIKLLLWYDNEWGYASKVVEILKYIDIKKG